MTGSQREELSINGDSTEEVKLPKGVLVALIRAAGGELTIDEYDVTYSDPTEELVVWYTPVPVRRWTYKLKENK